MFIRHLNEKLSGPRITTSMRCYDEFTRDHDLRDLPLSNATFISSVVGERIVLLR